MDWTSMVKSVPPGTPPSSSAPLGGAAPTATEGAGGIEVFELRDDKWYPMPLDTFWAMPAGHFCIGPWLLKEKGLYYCGNDATWKKLESKGDARRWTHDWVLDNSEYEDGMLRKQLRQTIAF